MRNLFFRTLLLISLFVSLLPAAAKGGSLRHITNLDGLTNSAVLSINQSSDGFMWFGTCDGLNFYDGMKVYPFEQTSRYNLSGNLIESIQAADDDILWVMTNYGVNSINTRTCEVVSFPEFRNSRILRRNADGYIFVANAEGKIFYYKEGKMEGFLPLENVGGKRNSMVDIIPKGKKLYVATKEGIEGYSLKEENSGRLSVTAESRFRMPISSVYSNDENIFIEGRDNHLMSYDPSLTLATTLLDLSPYTTERGKVSDITCSPDGSLFVAFQNKGVLKLKSKGDSHDVEDIGISDGVFCLKHDPRQNLVWIGADGGGVYVYDDDNYDIDNLTYTQFGNALTSPVRSVLIDDNRDMWFGTKGDGLIRIDAAERYNGRYLKNFSKFTTANSPLRNNSIYAMSKSTRPFIWIGGEEGLDIYDKNDGRIRNVASQTPLRYIHAIYQQNDSVLWLASVGHGVMRCSLKYAGGMPYVENVRQFTRNGGIMTFNYFFCLAPSKDGTIYFGNRGSGIHYIKDGVMKELKLKNKYREPYVDDIFSIVIDGETIWAGTGAGLLMISPKEERLFGPADGFPRSAVHDLRMDKAGNLWVATNKGIINYNPETKRSKWYRKATDLGVIEFSDGASFYDGNDVYFGGINGVVGINCDKNVPADLSFKPEISLTLLNVNGEIVNKGDFLKGKEQKLVLSSDENTFKVIFGAPDYINGDNYRYYYRMSDKDDWTLCNNGNTLSFTDLHYGSYNLQIKYLNPVSNVESDIFELPIIIAAPWYLSFWARLFYLLLITGIVYAVAFFYRRHVRSEQNHKIDSLSRKHKEKIYEEKLRFFTNITHEFCTPLTLIYGPCEKILSYSNSDEYINKYISMIKSNAERLNALIQEVIDLRRMETGNKKIKMRPIDVSKVCEGVISLFCELAVQNDITVCSDIEPGIVCDSDQGCLNKILYNLISNAFKYTPAGGTVTVTLNRSDDGRLRICVHNTGKGIKPEDRKEIFNRYRILDDVEENATKGLSARNGLGLAICHNVVKLLGGDIEIESEVGKYAAFIVLLPMRISDENSDDVVPVEYLNNPESEIMESESPRKEDVWDGDSEGHRVLVVDDNPDILTLVADSLTDYSVKAATNAEAALKIIRETAPNLIITDIMMPGMDGIEFTRVLKDDKYTRHIPVVILSAKNDTDDKVEALNKGADAYVGKPFKASYLESVVTRLLDSRQKVKEYFNTAASAYEYSAGKLVHKEDREFLESVVKYIDENIQDPDLNVEKIAENFQMGVRNLYRKFKDLEQPTPNDFIKRHRIQKAAKLLITTNRTVQEIMYGCGFGNRSHFYKEFAKHFEVTPGEYRKNQGDKKS